MLYLTLAWAVLLVVFGLLPGWAPGFIMDMVRPVWVFYAWLGMGIVLVILRAFLEARARKHRPVGAFLRDPGVLFVFLAIPVGLWFQPALSRQGDQLHYNSHRAKYRAVVDSIATSHPHRVEFSDASVGSFVVDTGPPVRVAFVRSSWLSDWEGVIFDPADSLEAWQEHSPHRSVRLFGRAVIGCNRREPQWFDCGTLPDRENAPVPIPRRDIDSLAFMRRR